MKGFVNKGRINASAGLQGFLQPSGSGVAPLPLPGLPRLPGSSGPPVLGLPSLPGFPLLPGGLPRNSQGQVDVVNLICKISCLYFCSCIV